MSNNTLPIQFPGLPSIGSPSGTNLAPIGNRRSEPSTSPPMISVTNDPPGSVLRGSKTAVIVSVDSATQPKFATVAIENHYPFETGYTVPVGAGPFTAGGAGAQPGFNYFYNSTGTGSGNQSASVTPVGVVQTQVNGASPSSSITTTLHAGPTTGNLLIGFWTWSRSANASVTAPTGYTVLGEFDNGTQAITIIYKIAGVGEPSSLTVTQASAGGMALRLVELSGAGTPTGFVTNTSPSITIAAASNGVAFAIFSANTPASGQPAGGWFGMGTAGIATDDQVVHYLTTQSAVSVTDTNSWGAIAVGLSVPSAANAGISGGGVGGSLVTVDCDRKAITAFLGTVSSSPPTPYYKALTDHQHDGNLSPSGTYNPQPVNLGAPEVEGNLPYGNQSLVVQGIVNSAGNVIATEFPGGLILQNSGTYKGYYQQSVGTLVDSQGITLPIGSWFFMDWFTLNTVATTDFYGPLVADSTAVTHYYWIESHGGTGTLSRNGTTLATLNTNLANTSTVHMWTMGVYYLGGTTFRIVAYCDNTLLCDYTDSSSTLASTIYAGFAGLTAGTIYHRDYDFYGSTQNTQLLANPSLATPPSLSGISGPTYPVVGMGTYDAAMNFTISYSTVPPWMRAFILYAAPTGSSSAVAAQHFYGEIFPVAGATSAIWAGLGAGQSYDLWLAYRDQQGNPSAPVQVAVGTATNPIQRPGLASVPTTAPNVTSGTPTITYNNSGGGTYDAITNSVTVDSNGTTSNTSLAEIEMVYSPHALGTASNALSGWIHCDAIPPNASGNYNLYWGALGAGTAYDIGFRYVGHDSSRSFVYIAGTTSTNPLGSIGLATMPSGILASGPSFSSITNPWNTIIGVDAGGINAQQISITVSDWTTTIPAWFKSINLVSRKHNTTIPVIENGSFTFPVGSNSTNVGSWLAAGAWDVGFYYVDQAGQHSATTWATSTGNILAPPVAGAGLAGQGGVNLVQDSLFSYSHYLISTGFATTNSLWTVVGISGTTTGFQQGATLIGWGGPASYVVSQGYTSPSYAYTTYPITLSPSTQYTISCFIDASQCTNVGSGVSIQVCSASSGGTIYATASQTAGGASVCQATFTPGVGVTQVYVRMIVTGATINSGKQILFHGPQLEAGVVFSRPIPVLGGVNPGDGNIPHLSLSAEVQGIIGPTGTYGLGSLTFPVTGNILNTLPYLNHDISVTSTIHATVDPTDGIYLSSGSITRRHIVGTEGANLIFNPNFAVSTNGWTGTSLVTTSHFGPETATQYGGRLNIIISPGSGYSGTDAYFAQDVSMKLQTNTPYTISFVMDIDACATGGFAGVDITGLPGTVVGSTSSFSSAVAVGSQVYYSFTFTTSNTTMPSSGVLVRARANCGTTSPASSTWVYITGVKLEQAGIQGTSSTSVAATVFSDDQAGHLVATTHQPFAGTEGSYLVTNAIFSRHINLQNVQAQHLTGGVSGDTLAILDGAAHLAYVRHSLGVQATILSTANSVDGLYLASSTINRRHYAGVEGRNLLFNPTFARNSNGWTASSNVTTSTFGSELSQQFGGRLNIIISSGSGYAGTDAYFYQDISTQMQTNTPYTISFWMEIDSCPATGFGRVDITGLPGSPTGTLGLQSSTSNNTMTYYSFTFTTSSTTMPSSGVRVRLRANCGTTSPASSTWIYISKVKLEQVGPQGTSSTSSPATPYSDDQADHMVSWVLDVNGNLNVARAQTGANLPFANHDTAVVGTFTRATSTQLTMPTSSMLLPQGSFAPVSTNFTVTSVPQSSHTAYSSGGNATITISWTAWSINYSDGSTSGTLPAFAGTNIYWVGYSASSGTLIAPSTSYYLSFFYNYASGASGVVTTGIFTTSALTQAEAATYFTDGNVTLLVNQGPTTTPALPGSGTTNGSTFNPPPPTCPGYNQVLMTKRGLVPAHQLIPGDHLMDWKEGTWNKISWVMPRTSEIYKVKLGGEILEVDKNHLWWSKVGWWPTWCLKRGDHVLNAEGGELRVDWIENQGVGKYIELQCERQRFRIGKAIGHNVVTRVSS